MNPGANGRDDQAVERIEDARPLGEVFNLCKEFAEQSFSGTTLRHIKTAQAFRSNLDLRENGSSGDEEWSRVRRAEDDATLVLGLTVYLFDKVVSGNNASFPRVFARTSQGDDRRIGALAMSPFGYDDIRPQMCRLCFQRAPRLAMRTREALVSMAMNLPFLYGSVWMKAWKIRLPAHLPRDLAENHEHFFKLRAQHERIVRELRAYEGDRLYFEGRAPDRTDFERITGTSPRPGRVHYAEMAEVALELYRGQGGIPFTKKRLADHLGHSPTDRRLVGIWTEFLSNLPDEERERLQRPGRRPRPDRN